MRRWDRLAGALLALQALALLVVVLVAHGTPLLGVETDLLGDSIPAARALSEGRITAETFLFRGPGYPLLLAAGSAATGGDEFLAARLVNVAAAVVASGMAFLIFRAFMGSLGGLAVALALAVNPVFLRASVEAGTDMPAVALALVATWRVTRGGTWGGAFAAGMVAAFASLTRYNMVFLAPAGLVTLALARAGGRRLVAFLAGVAFPILGWVLVHRALTGEVPRNQNYVNVAYEVYGQEMGFDRFWIQSGEAFRSFFDVLAYDPARVAAHVGWNVLTRWLEDARGLMPVWIGALAVPGAGLVWWRRPGWPWLLVHAGLAYLTLAIVFYNPRFFLYLLPFYLSGTFGLLLGLGTRPGHPVEEHRGPPAWLRAGGPVIAATLLVASAAIAIRDVRHILADAPDETRVAGELLRTVGHPVEAVMARKPHVAYFARMRYVPIPHRESLPDFLAEARRMGVNYLFVSAAEAALLPQLSILMEPGVSLPGLTPLGHRVIRPSHFYTLYRIVPGETPRSVVEDSLLSVLHRLAARHPQRAWIRTQLGGHLATMGRWREALAPLDEAERLDPADPLVARFQALAHIELGEADLAAAACERALRLVPGGGWEHGLMGQIRLVQGRYAEARVELRRAMKAAPSDPRHPLLYMMACAGDHAWEEAAVTAERILELTPEEASARLVGARAWIALGRRDRARSLVDLPGPVAGRDSATWMRLADSLRAATSAAEGPSRMAR